MFTESLLNKDRPAQGVNFLRFIAIHEAFLRQAPEYEGITDVVHQVDPEALVSTLEAVATTEDRRPFRDEERCVDRAVPYARLSRLEESLIRVVAIPEDVLDVFEACLLVLDVALEAGFDKDSFDCEHKNVQVIVESIFYV